MAKKSLEEELNAFLLLWDTAKILDFLRDVCDLAEMYDIDPENDWIKKQIDIEEDANVIRLIRTIYLISRMSSLHCGRLATTNAQFRHLWQRMENVQIDTTQMSLNEKV